MVRAATLLRQLRISMPSRLPSIPSLPPKPTFAPSTSASSSTLRPKPVSSALPAIPGLPPKPVALALSPVRASRRRSPSPVAYPRRSISPLPRRRRSPSPLPIRRRSPSPLARRRSPSPVHRRRSPVRRSPSPYARRRSPEPRRRSPPRYRVRSPSPRPSTRYREPSPSRSTRSYSAVKPALASRTATAAYSTTAERTARGRSLERSPSASPAPRKRQLSTSPPVSNKKVAAEPLPTGPTAPLVPTGPRADRIPTGPRADMPSRGRGRGGAKAASRAVFTPLSPPIHNLTQIEQTHGDGGKISLKPQWAENPKAPLANYAGGQAGGATNFGENGSAYQVTEGTVNGAKMFRVKVVADQAAGIVGIGDNPVRKEAEKLAAYSACLQLVQAGKLDNRKGAKQPAGPKDIQPSSNNPSDTAKLSDGSLISYDRARQFMEYYCQRFGFGKPDVMFESSSVKTRKSGPMVQQWEAVITVGGRRIGQGAGASKKTAQVKCYLDVTQYLESCDPDLWRNFVEASKKDTSGNIGQAPHILFQMSDDLTDEIGDLCRDVKSSTLYARRPPTGSSNVELEPEAQHRRVATQPASPEYIVTKSAALQDKLAAYQNDDSLAAMRAQRETLPIFSKANGILAKIEVNDVTIVMAATGSGKTTQVPQLLFDDWINRGEGAKCNIICTQPRRLAATSVAERVAEERGDVLGNEVGYQVRFDVKLPQPHGSITFCTTGIFLKRMQSALGAGAHSSARDAMDLVTHIVVDEVHERDIDTDLLLVVLKRLLADRKARGIPLKIILMSATVDPTLFQSYFADSKGRLAPIAEVPGRTFPVERHHLEDIVEDMRGNGLPDSRGGWVFSEKDVNNYLQKELSGDPAAFAPGSGGELPVPYALVALTIAHVLKQSDDGHVLVFLPGWDEIKKVSAFLLDDPRKFPLFDLNLSDTSKYSVHYLHSTIPAAEQREVFRPPPKGVRRIILATNIAETSVTIPDVVYVVDTARVKEKQYDPDRHMSSLVTAWVGSSNLNQRAGRAGRHRPGEYYGLLSRQRQKSLRAHQLVEMKRSDLSNVVMHVKALNLGVVEEVLAATIEPPEESRVVAAMNVLRMLGALDEGKNLTSLGKVLLQLPVEAAIGKLCLYGSFFRCLDSALTLASVLTNRDPFMAPVALKAQADAIKDSWSPSSFRSDPLAVVAAYNEWHSMQSRNEYRAANNFLSDNFLNKSSMLQIEQIKSSLLQSLDQAGVLAVSAGGGVQTSRFGRNASVPPELNTNGQSLPLLAALIAMASAPNFALRTSEKTCRTSQDKVVNIHASSVNSRRRETGGPEAPAAAFNPAEKRLYAFAEKQRNVPAGGNPNAGQTQLRSVTRLDPMTYMLFGAYHLRVTQRGLECDDWLPIVGNLDALDNVQRLKTLLDSCMLRVFEGVGKTIGRNRDRRYQATRNAVEVHQGTSMLRSNSAMDDGEGENESEDDEDTDLIGGVGKPRPTSRNWDPTLSDTEVKELDLLTADVVGVLDRYAEERDSSVSRRSSRPATPSYSGAGFGLSQRGPPTGPRNGGFGNGAGFSTNSGQAAYANLNHAANSYRPPIPGNVPTGPKAGRPADWRTRKQPPAGPSASKPAESQPENPDFGGW